MNELTSDQIEKLRVLKTNDGFKLYMEILQTLFNNSYKKLRDSKKSDSTYSRLCGYLDGIEKAMNLVDIETDE